MWRELRDKRGLVTGATSGIGAALSSALARAGAKLLITGRRSDRLEALRTSLHGDDCQVEALAGDLTDSAHRSALTVAVRERFQALDFLVNNAGIGAWGEFASADEARMRRVMEVNFFAPVELTRALLPLLRIGSQPLLVNIGSVLGHRSVPNKSEYCASKFALHGWSDAVRAEWHALGIDVLHVCPSTTRTDFFDRVLVDESIERPAPHRHGRGVMTPDSVARRVVSAMRRGRHEIILSPGGKCLVWLDRLWPWLADQLVARFGQEGSTR